MCPYFVEGLLTCGLSQRPLISRGRFSRTHPPLFPLSPLLPSMCSLCRRPYPEGPYQQLLTKGAQQKPHSSPLPLALSSSPPCSRSAGGPGGADQTDGYKLDKSHVFKVSMFDDFEKYSRVPDEHVPPAPEDYKPSVSPTTVYSTVHERVKHWRETLHYCGAVYCDVVPLSR